MKKNPPFVLLLALVAAFGCGSDSTSPAEAEKLKADLSKGGDRNAMGPESKKKFDEYMKNRGLGGGSPSAPPSAPSAGN